MKSKAPGAMCLEAMDDALACHAAVVFITPTIPASNSWIEGRSGFA